MKVFFMTEDSVILTAHQPVYLPWLGLFHKIALADKFVYFDDVQYQTRDWNNRNRIKTHQGEIWLSVPVFSKQHFQTKLKDIRINNETPWRRKHFDSIVHAYKKAPYFDQYIGMLEDIYKKEWERLSDLNEYMLKQFLKVLGIDIEFSKLSDYSFHSTKSDLVLDMCKGMKAALYIFGVQGKNYADVAAFEKEGIRVYFQDYQHPQYPQLHGGPFLPGMSVIDLLFNCGEKSLDIIKLGNCTREELMKKHFSHA